MKYKAEPNSSTVCAKLMPRGYKQYPSYRDSGVEWLGEIPEHWEVVGFKRYFKSIVDYRGKTPQKVDNGIFLVTARNIKKGRINYNASSEYVRYEDYDEIMSRGAPRLGDVLFTTEAPLGEVANIDDTNIALAQRVIKFSGEDGVLNNYYLKYFMMSISFQNSLMIYATGSTALGIKAQRLVYLRKLIPTYNEQKSIANYLDKATTKIDTLIEKQTQLIELLKEKRQAMVDEISNGANVTKMRLGRVTNQMLRPVSRKTNIQYEALGLYNRGRGLFHKPKKLEDELGDSDFYWVEEQDLILSGQFAWEGSVALADESENNCIVSHRYPVIRGIDGVLDTEYLWAYLTTREGDFLLNEHSVGSAGRNRPLNINTLMKESIPIPDFKDQLKVSRIVQSEKTIKTSIYKAIDLLKEKRTALISAAVTGKIDVRDAA